MKTAIHETMTISVHRIICFSFMRRDFCFRSWGGSVIHRSEAGVFAFMGIIFAPRPIFLHDMNTYLWSLLWLDCQRQGFTPWTPSLNKGNYLPVPVGPERPLLL